MPLAVAATGCALGLERRADGIPLADDGGELFADRLVRGIGFGLVVLTFDEQVVVIEQNLADGVAAAGFVRLVIAITDLKVH